MILYCLQETPQFSGPYINWKWNSEWNKILHANGTQQKAWVTILCSCEIDIKWKWESNYILIMESIEQEKNSNLDILCAISEHSNIWKNTNRFSWIGSYTLIVVSVNTTVLTIDGLSHCCHPRHKKSNKETSKLNWAIYKSSPSNRGTKWIFFSLAHETSSRMDMI